VLAAWLTHLHVPMGELVDLARGQGEWQGAANAIYLRCTNDTGVKRWRLSADPG